MISAMSRAVPSIARRSETVSGTLSTVGRSSSGAGAGPVGQAVDIEAEDVPGEEEQRAHCLVLGAGGHVAFHGEKREEVAHVGRCDLGLRAVLPGAGEFIEPAHPVDVGAFRPVGVVPEPKQATEFFGG